MPTPPAAARGVVDKMAAAYILQGALDRLRNNRCKVEMALCIRPLPCL